MKHREMRRTSPHFFFGEQEVTLRQEQNVIRAGMTVLVCALALRLLSGIAGPVTAFLAKPETASFLVYLETGRVVKPTITPKETQPETMILPPAETETPPPETTAPEAETQRFSPEDTSLVRVRNHSGVPLDLEALLLTPLSLQLQPEAPAVLIIHSHGTESYTQTAQLSYTPSGDYRTLDTEHNMLRVGEALKAALEARGIRVIHDRNLHDYPDYNAAYVNSRKTVESWLEKYPSVCMVIDLHRDAADTADGQLQTAATVDGVPASQLMLVVGSNAGGGDHSFWQENMALAVQLHATLEQRYPGICRPISFRRERFNQDLSPGALLIEVGAAGDTLEKALVAAQALGEGIARILLTANSTS